MPLLIDRVQTPVGPMLLASDGSRLLAVDLRGDEGTLFAGLRARLPGLQPIWADDPQGFSTRLRAYFGGDAHACDGLPVETHGTAFQREVWAALREIPWGTTTTYGALAARLGRAGASRAVGLANGQNPVPIVIPCHRVIGAGGKLTGYGGGLERKQWLLRHEGALLA